jgi:hypothetical protein
MFALDYNGRKLSIAPNRLRGSRNQPLELLWHCFFMQCVRLLESAGGFQVSRIGRVLLVVFDPAFHGPRGAEQQVGKSFPAKQCSFGAVVLSACQTDAGQQF